MSKLYELTTALDEVWKLVEDEDMDLQTLEDTIQSIEGSLEVKAEGIAKFVSMLEHMEGAYKAEISRMSARMNACKNKREGLEKYVKATLEIAGIKKQPAGTFVWTVQNNPAAVVIDDESKLPKKFVKTVITTSPDKSAIKDTLKSGEDVPGARLVTGTSIRLK